MTASAGRVIDNANISSGDVIVGLFFGQASYESAYNGGTGSNGLTSARHDVFKDLSFKISEAFDPSVSMDLIFSGTKLYRSCGGH